MANRRKSARSRGQIVQKAPGRFLVRVFLGRDAAGKRSYTSATVNGSRSDAEKALAKLLVGSDEQTLTQKSAITVQKFTEAYLDGRVDLSPKTLADYRHRMEKDVYPFLGRLQLSKVTREALQRLVKTLEEDRQLSPRTIKYTFVVLGQALGQAVLDGIIPRDPSAHLKMPKRRHTDPAVLAPDQMQLFLERTAQGDQQLHALWMLLLTAGLRPQEALALRWDDVDEANATVRIVRALKKVDTSRWEVGEVKTQAGKRTLPVPAEAIEALKAHRLRQTADILKIGPRYTRQGYIFACKKRNPGNHLDIPTVRRWWKKALADAGLPVMTLYATRHSHATALLSQGVNPKVAAERLGHSNVKVTLDVYSHVLPGMGKEASDLVGHLLFPRTGS